MAVMRVLILAPLWFPVSRDAHGGIETFLAALIEALEAEGCETALVASAESRTRARLIPAVPEGVFALMARGEAEEYVYWEQRQLLLALEHAAGFDVVHSHVGPGGLALSGIAGLRVLHTWHTQVTRDFEHFAARHPDVRLSTVSEFQAARLRRHAGVQCAVVPNGIDVAALEFRPDPGRGLVFIGRIEALKGTDLAVQAARATGLPLTVAGPIIDQAFHETHVVPHLDEHIRYVGVVDHAGKNRLLAGAACVLMPSRVDEACPLVCIEALASGTPVVALARGALPELIEPGVSGYVTADECELARLVPRALALDRPAIRTRAAARFDVRRVAARYVEVYHAVLRGDPAGAPFAAPGRAAG
jgi:glycosyltransferase involved in cell wall biosynthesis